MTLEVDPGRLVSEASEIAAAARRAVEALPRVRTADIHLELDDGGETLRSVAHHKAWEAMMAPYGERGVGS